MPKLLMVICLAVVLPSAAHAQFSYDDFLRNVEAGSGVPADSSPRVAQAESQESSLPAPSAQSPVTAPPANSADALPAQPAAQVPSLDMPPAAAPTDSAVPQPVPMPLQMPPASGPSPNIVNFDQLFADEQFGLSTGPGCGCEQTAAAPGCSQCNSRSSCNSCTSGCRSCRTGQCVAMAYYTPQLPPPSTLRGFFNASPCVANLWDNYACEAGQECAKLQQRVAPPNCGPCNR